MQDRQALATTGATRRATPTDTRHYWLARAPSAATRSSPALAASCSLDREKGWRRSAARGVKAPAEHVLLIHHGTRPSPPEVRAFRVVNVSPCGHIIRGEERRGIPEDQPSTATVASRGGRCSGCSGRAPPPSCRRFASGAFDLLRHQRAGVPGLPEAGTARWARPRGGIGADRDGAGLRHRSAPHRRR